MTLLAADLLRRRIRLDGGSPLLTYYDLDSGERTELSAVTFGNWVDKTSNLLVDELMLDPGDRVELALAESHPGHWVTLVWELACWQVGLVVAVAPVGAARLVVCGPDWTAFADADAVVACSLHPLGLGFAERLPAQMLDYGLEVRSQPDGYAAAPHSGLAAAWVDERLELTQAALVDDVPGHPGRRLVLPTDPWSTARQALLEPLVGGGSAVVVVGGTDDAVRRVADQELAEPE